MTGGVAGITRLAAGAVAAGVLLLGASVGRAAVAADLTGTWWISTYNSRLMPVDASPVPLKPAAKERYVAYVAARQDGELKDDTGTYCIGDGLVRASGSPFPFEIVAHGDQLIVLYEEDRAVRFINIGGERTPDDGLEYTFMGESIAHWEADALVVETVGHKDRTLLDESGLPHGEQLKTTERLRLLDDGEMLESLITIEDPEFYTRPWTVRFTYYSRPDVKLEEYVCGETHRDVSAVMRGLQTRAPEPVGLPPLKVEDAAWAAPSPAMARIWQRAPWTSPLQGPDETNRNNGNGNIPALTEGWDDRDEMLQFKPLALMHTYDAGVTAGAPPPTSSSSCDIDGFPSIIGLPNSWLMVPTRDVTYFIYSYNNQVRRVYMNAPHPEHVEPSWFGYSTGRWEGDTLVVRTTGLTDRSLLNWDGIPHSADIRITERYQMQPDGRLRLEMLLEDSKTFTGPWTVVKHFVPREGMEEYWCSENNRIGGKPPTE